MSKLVDGFLRDVFERSRKWDENRTKKIETMNLQLKMQEESELSFHPHINQSHGARTKKKITHDEAMEIIVMKNERWRQKRDEKIKVRQDDLLAEELNKCTFSPSFIRKKTELKGEKRVDKGHGDRQKETGNHSNVQSYETVEASPQAQSSSSLGPPDGFKNSLILFGRFSDGIAYVSDSTHEATGDHKDVGENEGEKEGPMGFSDDYMNSHKIRPAFDDSATDMYVSDDLFS